MAMLTAQYTWYGCNFYRREVNIKQKFQPAYIKQ